MRLFRAFLLSLALPVSALAQAPEGFMPGGIAYDTAIPTPEDAFGHRLGEQTVRYSQVVEYLREMAARSDRISIETIGQSVERRPIEFLTITSPDNHARLDEIRAKHLALSDPEADNDITADMPAVLWLGFGTHGAEAAGLEAAIPLVHHLAAGRGEAIEEILEDTVILVVAALNPDGHARRIDNSLSYTSNAVVRDPDHAGHDLWARQRANHYGYDLNRQWLLLAQHEPQIWVPKWHDWKPHFTADFHEMGTTSTRPTTFYFPPGEAQRANPLVPDESRKLLKRIGAYHASSLDARGSLYFSEDLFDSFYIGTASSYPNLHGSLGSLFEVGTAKLIEVDTPLGRRSLAENIETHFLAALNSIAANAGMRTDILEYRKRFYADALEAAREDDRGAFVFTSPDRARLERFVDVLRTHGIAVHTLARDVSLDERDYAAGESFIVPVAQSEYRMLRTVFDRVTEFEEPIFYDVSAWTLPLSYNLDYGALSNRAMQESLLGAPAETGASASETPPRASYGYVFSWTDHYAPRALYRLLEADLIVRAAMKPFTLSTPGGSVALERGAVFVPAKNQPLSPAQIHELVAEIAQREDLEVHGVSSGLTPSEGMDFGSGAAFGTLEQPQVLLLFRDGIQRFDMGHIWHLLDGQMEIPVVLKQKDRISEIEWGRYTHIILPGGWDVGLDAASTRRARQWVREQGGTFIGIRNGAEWSQKALLGQEPLTDRSLKGAPGTRFDLAELNLREAEDVVAGAIFASDLDLSHPLAFGYHRRQLPSHRDTSIRLATPDNPAAVVARYDTETPLLAGYASQRRQEELAGSPMMLAERLGAGSVVLMVDNPNFRGAFVGTNKLLMNSLFFSKLFDTPGEPGGARFRR